MTINKSGLIIRVKKISKSKIYDCSKLPYTKIFIFYSEEKELNFRIPKKIEIIFFTNLNDFNKKINQVYKDNIEYTILPYFSGDSNSKYAINIYNKTFSTNIDPKIFKEKDKMTDFLGDVAEKKYLKFTYKDLLNKKFELLSKELGTTFIIKPTNGYSSTNTFKIKSTNDLEEIKTKISKSYDYILEEYIGGNLYSLDLFCDGKNIYLLCLVRELAMIDMIESEKFSNNYIAKYNDELNKHFNFVIPIRYNLNFSKLSKKEIIFLSKIKNKLNSINFKGFIHLEYKFDRIENKIGFIEWGARLGWGRINYIKKIYNTDVVKLPYYFFIEKEFSKFTEFNKGIYIFRENEHNINIVGIKTNFIKRINYLQLFEKTGNYLNVSMRDYILKYFKEKFGVDILNINFIIRSTNNYNFYPFYKNNNTRFDYFIELNDENLTIFKKKKFKIIEDVFFHDYKK